MLDLAAGSEDLIDLDLGRVASVASGLLLNDTSARVLTVGGTNGKGSSVAFSEAILLSLGITVGAYTSPHILSFNERIRVNGSSVSDQAICDALNLIKLFTKDAVLTYFELATLAALQIFKASKVEVILLEVGLGGRLDAVNILDPDVSLITSIDLDHQAWLGNDRESIAIEKAGILRSDRPAVIADADPPKTIKESSPSTKFFFFGREWNFSSSQSCGNLMKLVITNANDQLEHYQFACPSGILPVNVGASVQALSLLGFTVSEDQLTEIANQFLLVGRLHSIFLKDCEILVDAAHNPASVRVLKEHLESNLVEGKNYAIFAAMADKDIFGMLTELKDIFDAWFVIDLPGISRSADCNEVCEILFSLGNQVFMQADIAHAWNRIWELIVPGDRLVVFGSFYTIGEVLPLIESMRKEASCE